MDAMASLALPTVPSLPAMPSLSSFSSLVGVVLDVPRQVASVVTGPSLLDRFDDDLEAVWEPFLHDED